MEKIMPVQTEKLMHDERPLGRVDALRTLGRMLNVRELSATIGISGKQVYALAGRGAIPHIRIGRSLRFDPYEVAQWLRAHSCGRSDTADATTLRRTK